jgi:large subunit ribosomal protein L25
MEIKATKREKLGKSTKSLRKNRQIPAVIYGEKIKPTPLTINTLEFKKVFKEAGETTLIDVKYNNSNEKVLVKEVQLHPVTLEPIHVSFHKVDLTEKIRADIPVEITGEEECEIVQKGEGMVLTLLTEIEVEALPTDLPSNFEVNISRLAEVGQGITVEELNYDKKKVEIVGAEEDELIVKIDYAEMEEEEEEEEITEEELIEGMEVTGEKEEEEEGEEEPKPKEEKESKPSEEGPKEQGTQLN